VKVSRVTAYYQTWHEKYFFILYSLFYDPFLTEFVFLIKLPVIKVVSLYKIFILQNVQSCLYDSNKDDKSDRLILLFC